jgi:hypothetical protein
MRQSSPVTEARSDEGPSASPEGPEEANHGRDPHHRSSPDPAGAHRDAATVADAGGVADPRRLADSRRITTEGDGEMKISGGVRERSSGSAVPAGAADVAEKRASERRFGNRTRLLHEVVRIQRAHRATEPARVLGGSRPTSAASGASSGSAEGRRT